MSHFAELNENNIVVRVIVAEEDFINSGVVGDPAKWVQTSYNGNIRKNYAGIGYTYDANRDAFIAPKPYASWTLDEVTCRWQAPEPHPQDGGQYVWNEAAATWQSV